VRIDVLGPVSVTAAPGATLAGQALGGRRARVVLVLLALADGPVPAQRLADALWGEDLPATWPAALRGVIRGLRTTLAALDAGDQAVIATVPSGYQLGTGVEVDVRAARAAVRQATTLATAGRAAAVLEVVEPLSAMRGEQLLPGEDADWLLPHRRAVDAIALDATELGVAAAGELGEHARAVELAQRCLAANVLDERAHRAVLRALDRAGDRAGVVRAYEDCRAVLADQLGVDPSPGTVAVYLDALNDQAGSVPARLPRPTTTFVGRAVELAALVDRLESPGLITVTGRGGVGKSRLAVEAAARPAFPGGRLWVSLAPVVDDALVAASVALELQVPLGADDPSTAIAAQLSPLGRTLLVLDGCEETLDGSASLVAALVAACPALTVLVTSRLPLGVDPERVVVVDPLPEPAPGEVSANPQVRILSDRVREGGGSLAVDESTASLLVELCDRCGGLPLALELAAAQLTALPVGDLLDQLAVEVVDGSDRLRSLAQSSYAALDVDEATVFRRFAVLEGGVGLPLIRSVVSGGSIAPVRVVRVLRELTARGLLNVDRTGARWSYRQDDDLHRFARELLVADGAEADTFARLAGAVRALLPDDARLPPAPYLDAVTEVLPSVRSLFGASYDGRADRTTSLELAFRLHRYWAATNVAEGRYWLARLLSVSPDSEWTRLATYALGYLSYWAGDTDAALRELGQAVELFGAEPDPYVARATIFLAGILDDMDRPDEAIDYVRRSIKAAEPFGTDLRVSAAMGMGSVLSERGDVRAAAYAADAITLCRDGGSPEQLTATLPTAAMVCWQVGALDEARAFVVEAQPKHAQDRRIARVVMLSAAAGIALAEGDLDAALDYGVAAETEGTALGIERELPLIRAVLARTRLARGEVAAAAAMAAEGVRAATGMGVTYPLAIGLETAALLCPDAPVAADLLATAADIRTRGSRPAPATLRADAATLAARLGPGAVLDATAGANAAIEVLTSRR
jgi:predicted ATPase/DNA-binding SARP family transcriptional activator